MMLFAPLSLPASLPHFFRIMVKIRALDNNRRRNHIHFIRRHLTGKAAAPEAPPLVEATEEGRIAP